MRSSVYAVRVGRTRAPPCQKLPHSAGGRRDIARGMKPDSACARWINSCGTPSSSSMRWIMGRYGRSVAWPPTRVLWPAVREVVDVAQDRVVYRQRQLRNRGRHLLPALDPSASGSTGNVISRMSSRGAFSNLPSSPLPRLPCPPGRTGGSHPPFLPSCGRTPGGRPDSGRRLPAWFDRQIEFLARVGKAPLAVVLLARRELARRFFHRHIAARALRGLRIGEQEGRNIVGIHVGFHQRRDGPFRG